MWPVEESDMQLAGADLLERIYLDRELRTHLEAEAEELQDGGIGREQALSPPPRTRQTYHRQ
jgi:hypothetical protein